MGVFGGEFTSLARYNFLSIFSLSCLLKQENLPDDKLFFLANLSCLLFASLFTSFSHQQIVFQRSLSDIKSPQVTRTLLSILIDLSNGIIWMVLASILISISSSLLSMPLGTLPSATIIIIIMSRHLHRYP